jgi:hypothetical protein
VSILHHTPTPVHPDPLDDVEPFMSAEDCREEDAPGEPTLPMPDWIEVQAQTFLVLNDSTLGRWLADRIFDLASEARFLQASTPDEFDGRSAVMAGLISGHDAMSEGGR